MPEDILQELLCRDVSFHIRNRNNVYELREPVHNLQDILMSLIIVSASLKAVNDIHRKMAMR